MAYVEGNPPTKKALLELVARGNVRCFQPGFGPSLDNFTGEVVIEGPHFPKPHKWYASVTLVDGIVTKVK